MIFGVPSFWNSVIFAFPAHPYPGTFSLSCAGRMGQPWLPALSALLPVPNVGLGLLHSCPAPDNSPFPRPSWCVKTPAPASVPNSSGAARFPPAPANPTEAAWGRMEKRRRTLKGGKKISAAALKGGGREGTRRAGDTWGCTPGCAHTNFPPGP